MYSNHTIRKHFNTWDEFQRKERDVLVFNTSYKES